MNDAEIRASAIYLAAGVAAIVLPWLLGTTLGWPGSVIVLVAVALLVVVGALAVRAWEARRHRDALTPRLESRPAVAVPMPPSSARIGPVPIPSGDAAYRFRFTAAVCWQHRPDGSNQDRNQRAARAHEALLDRAITAARQIPPHEHAAAVHRLTAALAAPLLDPTAGVQVWATDVIVGLDDEDAERLEKLERIRKDLQLWEEERAHERQIRRYLSEDALSSAGTALVWWLARNEDNINGALEHIPALARISAVAQDRLGQELLDSEWYEAQHRVLAHSTSTSQANSDSDSAAVASLQHVERDLASATRTAMDGAQDLLDGLFPDDNEDRGTAARHLAKLVAEWGQSGVAAAIRRESGGVAGARDSAAGPATPRPRTSPASPASSEDEPPVDDAEQAASVPGEAVNDGMARRPDEWFE